eukprot:TRINITY_DN8699_c0_g1_i5.p1 TRINITY_DN8699_c0_g1~~TRINITY_DN8699_c0_g1_i5.p1  ORF type:complete len:309 (+),score=52.86 TRINITY_DN8699_c0_g1_i5:24-950(+)
MKPFWLFLVTILPVSQVKGHDNEEFQATIEKRMKSMEEEMQTLKEENFELKKSLETMEKEMAKVADIMKKHFHADYDPDAFAEAERLRKETLLRLVGQKELTKENLKTYLELAYKNCTQNMLPLFDAYDNVINNYDVFDINIQTVTKLMKEAILDVYPLFFAAKSAKKHWNLNLVYIPEIEQSVDNLRGNITFVGETPGGVQNVTEQVYSENQMHEDGFKTFRRFTFTFSKGKIVSGPVMMKFHNGIAHGYFRVPDEQPGRLWLLTNRSEIVYYEMEIQALLIEPDKEVETYRFDAVNLTWTKTCCEN